MAQRPRVETAAECVLPSHIRLRHFTMMVETTVQVQDCFHFTIGQSRTEDDVDMFWSDNGEHRVQVYYMDRIP